MNLNQLKPFENANCNPVNLCAGRVGPIHMMVCISLHFLKLVQQVNKFGVESKKCRKPGPNTEMFDLGRVVSNLTMIKPIDKELGNKKSNRMSFTTQSAARQAILLSIPKTTYTEFRT